MKAYNILLVLKSNLGQDGVNTILNDVQSRITENEGQILSTKTIGNRDIHNGFNKEKKGGFYEINFSGNNNTLEKLQHHLSITETLLRGSITRLDSLLPKKELEAVLENNKEA